MLANQSRCDNSFPVRDVVDIDTNEQSLVLYIQQNKTRRLTSKWYMIT